jgi:hypothetical protein
MPNEKPATAKRVRSPNYPAIGLSEAVQQIQKLFERISQHAAPRDALATGMGYSGLHGASATAISALMKYGLLDRDGEDYKLSERAMKIIAPHSASEKAEALHAAAKDPTLFAELIDHFKGDVPNDDLMRSYLMRRGFATAAIPQVIQAFRETMELVTRDGNLYLPSEQGDQKDEDMEQNQERTPTKRTGEREFFSSPLSSQTRVRILVEGPAGPKEIDKLIRMLTIQKEVIQEDDNEA